MRKKLGAHSCTLSWVGFIPDLLHKKNAKHSLKLMINRLPNSLRRITMFTRVFSSCCSDTFSLPASEELLQEGQLELGADLLSLLLLLLEVLLQLVGGETHFGVASSVRCAMCSQPGTQQTLGCGGPPPVTASHHIR